MNVDHLNPKYPEHLNPFRRSSNTLTRSFRGIKNAIVKSFTGKDKEQPVIRPKQGIQSTNRTVFSMPPNYKEPPIAFPRSRFSERIIKTEEIRASTINKKSIWGNVGQNPFDNGDENEAKANIEDNTLLTPPKPAIRTKHKKRKKKAPGPPGSVSGSVSGSKWSLNSTESDISSMCCYSETEIDYMDRSTGDNEEILSLTRQIAKFTEDTNNNNIPNDTPEEISEKISEQKDETDSSKEIDLGKTENVSVRITDDAGEEAGNSNNLKADKSDISEEIHIQDPTTSEGDESFVVVNRDLTLEISSLEVLKEDEIDVKDPNKNQPVSDNSDSSSVDINYNVKKKDSSVEDVRVEVEGNSLDTTERRVSVKGTIEFFENGTPSPTAKIRKNILTKENLLGSESI